MSNSLCQLDPERIDADKLKGVMTNLEYVVIPNEDHFSAGQTREFSERILDFLRRHPAGK